ncbi:hypothetical protein Q3C01_43020 [Bradyrhizobium sp. UFLA05-109]
MAAALAPEINFVSLGYPPCPDEVRRHRPGLTVRAKNEDTISIKQH